MTSFAVLALSFLFSFSIFSFSFSIVFYFFVLVLVFVNEFLIFSFFTIFVFVFVNENHTAATVTMTGLRGDCRLTLWSECRACLAVKCPELAVPSSASRNTSDNTYLTYAHYQCVGDTRMLDGSTYRTILCDAAGLWSDIVTDCRGIQS